ncbi:MAG: hypothetical protein JST00_48330 [Deltaproteobacteria bacterium]|nr:hypothetical protein [Deltaproteobacteria bacterium]
MSSGSGNRPALSRVLTYARGLDPRLAAIAITFGLGGVALFATCGGCGHAPPGSTTSAAASSSATSTSDASVPARRDEVDASQHDPLLWEHAKTGEAEDLSSLAAHEGAVGLIEVASSDVTLKPTALRAMGFARGWAQLPFLVKIASGKSDDEAKLALDATIELAARVRRAEDPEDAEELREGCDGLDKLARDAKSPRVRRVSAIRALRMMPCPPSPVGELPSDVDAK